MEFFSFALHNVKKILINQPKSFHDWKMKFFFIREEIIHIAMLFCEPGAIPKEDTPIPKKAAWYDKLMATPNRVFGEQVLVTTSISDKWPERSKEVPMLLLNGEEFALYHSAFQTFSRAMGRSCLPNPAVATQGARNSNPRPCRTVTYAGKEIVYLSSEESVASSNHELSSWDDVFAGVPRDLGVDHEEKWPKKKVTVTGGAMSKKVGATLTASDAASKEGSKGPDSSATPSSIHEEAETEEPEAGKLIRKRSRVETTATTPPTKKVVTSKPIGKKGSFRSLYSKVSPEAVAKKPEVEVKKMPSHQKFNIIPPELLLLRGKLEGLDPPVIQRKEPEVQAENPTAQHTIPIQTETVQTTAGGSAGGAQAEGVLRDATAAGGDVGGSDAAARKDASGKKPRQPSPICVEDTLGDIYYKTYDETRATETHAPVWNLKQNDTFADFGACRESYLGSFPSSEVHQQKERGHDNMYRSYVMGQANASSTGHEILREWRTMHLERAGWEKYRERLSAEAKLFE
ncbi:hypothetical protein Hanom_Chr05g00419271 [Helianthus anomalus]